MGHQGRGGADPLVVSGLLGNMREHASQVGAGVADPPGLGSVPVQQVLGHGQAEQFRVGE